MSGDVAQYFEMAGKAWRKVTMMTVAIVVVILIAVILSAHSIGYDQGFEAGYNAGLRRATEVLNK